jgi:hypothetical protein
MYHSAAKIARKKLNYALAARLLSSDSSSPVSYVTLFERAKLSYAQSKKVAFILSLHIANSALQTAALIEVCQLSNALMSSEVSNNALMQRVVSEDSAQHRAFIARVFCTLSRWLYVNKRELKFGELKSYLVSMAEVQAVEQRSTIWEALSEHYLLKATQLAHDQPKAWYTLGNYTYHQCHRDLKLLHSSSLLSEEEQAQISHILQSHYPSHDLAELLLKITEALKKLISSSSSEYNYDFQHLVTIYLLYSSATANHCVESIGAAQQHVEEYLYCRWCRRTRGGVLASLQPNSQSVESVRGELLQLPQAALHC